MANWRRMVLGLTLAALGAALFTLAFPPYDLWPLIFVGLIPMVVAQHRVLPRRLAGLALGVGVGGFFWGYFGGLFAGGPWFMGWLPLIIGLVAALIGSCDRAFHRRTGYRWFVLHGAAVWVGVELIRGAIPVIGTWGFVGYALYEQPWLIQPVSLFGIYGLDLLILLVNYALALGVLALFDRRPVPASGPVDSLLARRWLLITGALCIGWTAYSLLTFHTFRFTPPVRVAAIQPAFKIKSERGLQKQFALTRQAAAQDAQLIVWHEGALPFDPQVQHTAELQTLAAQTEAYLVIGYVVRTDQGLRNEATVLTPAGDFLGVYGKDHPVAFAGETSLTRGAYPVYATELGRVGTVICYDLDFTDTARKVARNGAQIMAAPSADWPAIAAKHYSHAVFRAVENRVAIIKADVAFDSAIIDPAGRILRRAVSTDPRSAVLIADLPLAAPSSLKSSDDLQAADRLDDLEKARLAEALHLKETLGDAIWLGWGRMHIPVLLWNEEYAFLVGHPEPPSDWREIPDDLFQGQPYYRRRWSDPQAFTVYVRNHWVASMSTKAWTQESLKVQIRNDLPQALKPIFPYRLIVGRYTSDWHIVSLLHESFHAYQAEVAPARFTDAQRAYRVENRYGAVDAAMRDAWEAEIDLLVQAVKATSDAEAAELAGQFLTRRLQRRQEQELTPALVAYERRLEWLEGLAKYVELSAWRQASSPGYEPLPDLNADPDFYDYATFAQRWSQELEQMQRQATREGDGRFYYTGMAQAMLLDRLMPGWQARILSEDVWLEGLLGEAVGNEQDDSTLTIKGASP